MHLEKTLWQKNACPFKSLLYCALESATSLENWNFLCGDVDGLAGARVASGAGFALARRKGPETAQLDPPAIGELVGDFIEENVDDLFDVFLTHVGMLA